MNNENIIITQRAVDRFLQLFSIPDNGNTDKEQIAQKFIRHAFTTASYRSDDERGILFRSRMLQVDMIIKDKQITALIPFKNRQNISIQRLENGIKRNRFHRERA